MYLEYNLIHIYTCISLLPVSDMVVAMDAKTGTISPLIYSSSHLVYQLAWHLSIELMLRPKTTTMFINVQYYDNVVLPLILVLQL